MNKKIVKVMVFYADGTFDECIAGAMVKEPSLTYPPGVRAPTVPFTPVSPAHVCMRCGENRTGSCGKLECPNGYTNPWDNSTKVTD